MNKYVIMAVWALGQLCLGLYCVYAAVAEDIHLHFAMQGIGVMILIDLVFKLGSLVRWQI